MMSHFLFIENEDLICKYGFHMLSPWKLVTQDRPLWLDQLCGTGRVSGVRVVRVCNIQKRKGLVYQCTMSHFTFHIYSALMKSNGHGTYSFPAVWSTPCCSLSDTALNLSPGCFLHRKWDSTFWDYFQDPWFLRLLSRFLEIWNWDIRDTGWYWYDSMTSVFCRYENCPILQSSHEVSMAQAPSAVASTASRKSYMMPSTLPEDSLDSSISRN